MVVSGTGGDGKVVATTPINWGLQIQVIIWMNFTIKLLAPIDISQQFQVVKTAIYIGNLLLKSALGNIKQKDRLIGCWGCRSWSKEQ